jgi:hypothetical protein
MSHLFSHSLLTLVVRLAILDHTGGKYVAAANQKSTQRLRRFGIIDWTDYDGLDHSSSL